MDSTVAIPRLTRIMTCKATVIFSNLSMIDISIKILLMGIGGPATHPTPSRSATAQVHPTGNVSVRTIHSARCCSLALTLTARATVLWAEAADVVGSAAASRTLSQACRAGSGLTHLPSIHGAPIVHRRAPCALCVGAGFLETCLITAPLTLDIFVGLTAS